MKKCSLKKYFLFLLFFTIYFSNNFAFCAGNYTIKELEIKDEKLFSIECRDIDIKDLLRAIAKENNLNLIVSEDIDSKVTLSFEKISLRNALDSILKSNKLSYVVENDVIRVIKEADIEKKAEEKDVKKPEPKYITEIIKLSYANSNDLVMAITPTLSESESVTSDGRTNSLVLNVNENKLENIKAVIEKLDTQTKQIWIKAKIVETTEDISKEIGIQWGGNYSMNPIYGTATGYTFPNTVSIVGGSGAGNYAVNLPAVEPTSGIGINFGSITRNMNLDMRLSAMEKSGRIKIVSNPHIATLNDKPAKIHSGITFRVRTSSNVTAGDSSTLESELEEIKVGIDLTVTPKISHDNLIELNIDATKSEPDFTKVVDGIPGIIDKNANTTVLVKNGEPTVIGGLYKNSSNKVTRSVPFLSKIPILGWFFRSEGEIDTNEELLIFITPVLVENSDINVHLTPFKNEE